jgi:pimeloyl-ACP methyl ester carboxylesterase
MILGHDATGDGPPVVLLHGLGLSRAVFDPVLPALSSRFRVLRLDLRGHGASPAPDPPVPYVHADDVRATLDALGLDRVDLVGQSLGGAVAVDLALAHPERVRRLALLAPALSGWAWSDAWVQAFHTVRAVGRLGGPKAALEAWHAHPLFATARAHPGSAAALETMVFADDGRRWVESDVAVEAAPPAVERLARLEASTHVFVGEHDLPDFRAIAETMATHVPAIRLLVVPGAGHLLTLEAPEATARGLVVALSTDVDPHLRKPT